jgi:hypothetical protein
MKWFKHDTDANMDAKLQEVMLDYGLEGYGLYWYCIELIAQNVNGDNLTFELEHDARIIARNTGSTAQKVEQMMTSFINLGLLNSDNGHIFCLKLAARCDDFTAKAVRRNGIKAITNQSVGVSPTNSEKVPLEEEVRSKKKKKEKEVEIEIDPAKAATDFSSFGMTDDQVSEVKRIRRKNKGGAITQRVANALAKEFHQAATLGYSFDELITEWELRGWKSFKSEWIKPRAGMAQNHSAVTDQNIKNIGEWLNE